VITKIVWLSRFFKISSFVKVIQVWNVRVEDDISFLGKLSWSKSNYLLANVIYFICYQINLHWTCVLWSHSLPLFL